MHPFRHTPSWHSREHLYLLSRIQILGRKIRNLYDTNNSFAGDTIQDSSGRGVLCSRHETLMDESTLARVANDHLFASTVAKNLLRLFV